MFILCAFIPVVCCSCSLCFVLINLMSAEACTQLGNFHMLDGIFEISIDKNFSKVVNSLKHQDYLLSLECL